MKLREVNFAKGEGLVTVVAQEFFGNQPGPVRMVASANKEAVALTQHTRLAHFWSRSRKELWQKGKTSGNVLKVEAIYVDCDADALIYRVVPKGATCHTGERSCFFRKLRMRKGKK